MLDMIKLKQLAEINPEIIPTRDGAYTLSISGKCIHSRFSPYKEAERLLKDVIDLEPSTTLVIVLACGLGYHLDILEKKGFKHIVIIERDPVAYEYFTRVYDTSNIRYRVDPDETFQKMDSIFAELDIKKFRHIKTVILRGAADEEAYAPVEDRIKRHLKVKMGDFATRLRFEELWFSNILRNVHMLNEVRPASTLFGRAMDIPVAIISAGPSLKQSLPMIQQIRSHTLLIAVDTALLPLYEYGIVPDFVYSLDAQVHNILDLSMIDTDYLSRINLVFDTVVSPAFPENFPGRKFIANTAHLEYDLDGNPYYIKSPFVSWIEDILGFTFGDVETGGSVATSAFHFAYLLGGNPIYLFGQDLAYSGNASHCSSTSHYFRFLAKSSRFKPLMSQYLSIMRGRNVIQVPALGKGKTYTDFLLNNYRGWFEESARNLKKMSPVKLINASNDGAKIGEYTHLNDTALKKTMLKGKPIDRNKIFSDIKLIDPQNIDTIFHRLYDLNTFVSSLDIEPGIFERVKNSDFSFLEQYFARENILYERNDIFEKHELRRKLRRLLKNLNEGIHGG